MKNQTPPVDWLLENGEPWVRYLTLRELQGLPADDSAVTAAHRDTVAHPLVQGLLADLSDWPGTPLKRHNDAAHPLHKLAALAEFGLTQNDNAMTPIIERVLSHQAKEGAFTINMQIAERYGGDGQPHPMWMLCDAPTTLYALLAFGLEKHPKVSRAIDHLTGLMRDNGWPCAAAERMGVFRGPGRKGDPCPYANLVALKAISRIPHLRDSDFADIGVETLLWHWEIQKERKLYLFGIGTDFRKPKYPLIWSGVSPFFDFSSENRIFSMLRQVSRFFSVFLGTEMVQI